MALVPVSSGPTHRFVGLHNVLVSFYRSAPPTSALKDRIEWMERGIETYEKIGLFVVVSPTSGVDLPGAAFRAESKAQAVRFRGGFMFSGSVVEGSGIYPTLIRTFMRGLAVTAGKHINVRLFSEVAVGARWVEALAKPYGGPSEAALIEAVQGIRREL